MDGWIVIPDWRRFQHYKDRHPPWIKIYPALNSQAEWMGYSMATRGLLVTCWLEYARSNGQLSVEQIRSMYGVGFKYAHLESLNDAGSIRVVASKPDPLVPEGARTETEKETDKDNRASTGTRKRGASASTYGELMAAARRYAAGWNGGTSDAFETGLDELETLTGTKLQAGDRYRLWDEALEHRSAAAGAE